MRLIDADALVYEDITSENGNTYMVVHAPQIDNAPTIDDVELINTQGLAECIRCAMCTNHMKSDSGCDGGCKVDEHMYKKVMDAIQRQFIR